MQTSILIKDVNFSLRQAIRQLEFIESEVPEVSPIINELAKIKEKHSTPKTPKNIIEEHLDKVNKNASSK